MYLSKTKQLYNRNTQGNKNLTQTTFTRPAYTTGSYERKTAENQLDMEILEAIDISLASFGESVKQVVYFQLQTNHHVEKQDIPSKIEEFTLTVEEIFGAGAILIEMKIMETLYARTEGFLYKPKSKDLMFKDYVQTVRHFMADVTN
jgi:hypothetical protein